MTVRAKIPAIYEQTIVYRLGKLGIEQRDPAIRYWVKQHDIKHVKTRTTYPLQSNSVEVEHESGQKSKLSASGGIDMDVMVLNLEDGMPDTIKQYVLAARPEGAPLSWDVPLAARSWTLDHNGRAIESAIERHREQGNFGMSIQRRLQPFQNGQPMPMRPDPVTVPPTSQLQFAPPRRASHQMPTTRLRQVSSDIGGVMLEGAAQVQSDDGNAGLSIAAGNFSLVLGDRDSRVHPRVYRRFVTALWCVYLGDTDPGISIDPIAPGADRQLVRYIGHIRNTDLARVMREADYVMKKWAVGTDRPDVKGFNSPDEYSAQRGVAYLDSMSRFWFVPKDMRFRSTGNALIFDRGQMTVQTEFLMNNAQGLQADPANEDFARWFTKFYPEVAEQYPVYQALFEYSKHVSLANYLKNSDMPLFWFLLANRDLVLTEDSPGTVDTLRADSDALKGVRIEGGVQLVSKPEYILDREARSAIEKAHAQQLARRASTTTTDDTAQAPSPTLMKTVSVAMGDRAYTFVPQHSASSGVDRRGVRYQTDLSINEEGFVITKATLQEIKPELHRHFLWEGLRPYVKQMKDKQDNKAQRQVFEQKYEEAWSAAEHETARVLERLGPIMDKKYMDAAKFENDLAFVLEGDDLLTARELIARRAHYRTQFDLVRFSAPFTNEQATEFGAGWRLLVPYRLTFSDETVAFRNVALPRQVTLVDQLHGKKETLTFSEDHPTGAVGYFPAGNSDSLTIGLYLMADLTFQLEDKLGCRFEFNGNGQMTAMVLTETHRMSFEHEPLVSFDVTPYELQPMREAGTVTVVDGQVAVPKRLRIVDAHERERSFVFNSDAATIEWLPDDAQAKDRFKRIAMMADGSFRLHDRFGHRIRFDRTGAFDSVIPSPDSHCVSQLGFGHQKVKFRYEINREGRLVVDEAWAYVDPENDVPSYVVDYRYDQSFRLAGREIETAAGEPVDWRQKY